MGAFQLNRNSRSPTGPPSPLRGCGLTAIRTRDYILATAIGIVPGTFIYQYLFATLGRKVLDEGFEWRDLMQPDVLAALGAFVAFLVITKWLVNRIKRRPV